MTDRLVLRPFTMEDVPAVHSYASDPDVRKYMLHGPSTREETSGFVRMAVDEAQREPCVNLHLAVVERSTGRLVGGCSLEDIDRKNKDADLGYCLEKSSWNRGYATETARALAEFGFRTLGLHRIHATCRPANHASARVLEKVGMQKEGHLRAHRLVGGAWADSLLYAFLASDWARNSIRVVIDMELLPHGGE